MKKTSPPLAVQLRSPAVAAQAPWSAFATARPHLPPSAAPASCGPVVEEAHVGERMAAVALWFTRRERDTAAATAYRNDTFSVLRVAAAPDAAAPIVGEPGTARHEPARPGSLPA